MTRLALRSINPFYSTLPSLWDEENWGLPSENQGLDVYETDNEIVVKAPLPGIPLENVHVTLEDGVLRITGKREEKEEEKQKKKVIYQSNRFTSFDYTTTLPRAIDAEKINAEIDNGVLVVTVPIAAASKPKQIVVSTKK